MLPGTEPSRRARATQLGRHGGVVVSCVCFWGRRLFLGEYRSGGVLFKGRFFGGSTDLGAVVQTVSSRSPKSAAVERVL